MLPAPRNSLTLSRARIAGATIIRSNDIDIAIVVEVAHCNTDRKESHRECGLGLETREICA
jgi:hypothetical protein